MSEPGPFRRDWVIAALVVSVGLNCLVGGYYLGLGITPVAAPAPVVAGSQQAPVPILAAPAPSAPSPVPVYNVGERLKQLSPEENKKFQEAMRPFRSDINRERADLEEYRERLAEALQAQPYDPERMRKAFAELRTKSDQIQGKVQDATAQALTAISPAARKQLGTP